MNEYEQEAQIIINALHELKNSGKLKTYEAKGIIDTLCTMAGNIAGIINTHDILHKKED